MTNDIDDERIAHEWARLTGAITGFCRDHIRRGAEFVRSRGLPVPTGDLAGRLLCEIGAMVTLRDWIARGDMQVLWPECRHTAKSFELWATVYLYRLLTVGRVNAPLGSRLWSVISLRLRRELWWGREDATGPEAAPGVLFAAEVNDTAVDALAELLWAQAAKTN